MKYVACSLRQLLDEGVPRNIIQEAFDDFNCSRNEDVENFLKNYAIANECIGASRSYLYIDYEALKNDSFTLLAFFTIAITATDYSKISKRKRRVILGNYPRVSKEDHFPGFLLAQLARDDRYTKEDFDCSNLLGIAEEMIQEAANSIGGNAIYLDCVEDLIGYYQRFGYELLPEEPEEDAGDDIGSNKESAHEFFKMFKGLPRIEFEER